LSPARLSVRLFRVSADSSPFSPPRVIPPSWLCNQPLFFWSWLFRFSSLFSRNLPICLRSPPSVLAGTSMFSHLSPSSEYAQLVTIPLAFRNSLEPPLHIKFPLLLFMTPQLSFLLWRSISVFEVIIPSFSYPVRTCLLASYPLMLFLYFFLPSYWALGTILFSPRIR